MFFGHNFSKIEALQVPSFESIDINDAIEFFQIKQYFDTGARAKTWSDETYSEYKSKCEKLAILTNRFFNQLNNDNIIECYNSIEWSYHSDFWALFDKCKLFDKITSDIFKQLINGNNINPYDLFMYKNIVRKYGDILKQYIMQNECGIDILLHVYEQDYVEGGKQLILPLELTSEDICTCIECYIDGDCPNINCLQNIVDMHCEKQFKISDEIRLKAKRRLEKEIEKLSKMGGTSFLYEIQILFNPEQSEEKIVSHNGKNYSISYSTKWLLETLDYPSILNNFIYIFEFVDFPQMRCTHVNRISQSGVFERALASKSSRVYPVNSAFRFLNKIALMQMHSYYIFLKKHNIQLEDVIKWFFTEHIQSEFGCPEIRMTISSSDTSYAEKCSSIITTFESVLKQYALYAKNGEIDFELLEMSTKPVRLSDIKSIVEDKYIYGVGEDYKRLSFWLFSDQCMLSYVERIHKEGRSYSCLIDLILKETIYISDYRKEDHKAFENMASYNLIEINDDGRILPKDISKLLIMRELFQYNVISKWNYPFNAENAISEFLEKGVIESRSTLFSKPEIDYFNYLLNRTEYSNGLELRNKYIHGTKQVIQNEDEHMQNYFVFLILFILFAIKVNDEFCIKRLYKDSEI